MAIVGPELGCVIYYDGDILLAKISYDYFVDVYSLYGSDPTKEGYTFLGWSVYSDNRGEILDRNDLVEGKTLKLYAVWGEVDNDFCLHSNGGVWGENITEKTFSEKINRGMSISSIAGIPTRDGYTCMGWSSQKNGDIEYATNFIVPGNLATSDLYAIWYKDYGHNLSSFLTDISDGVRTKLGTADPIPVGRLKEKQEEIVTLTDAVANEPNFKEENIADGVTIFGKTGTHKGVSLDFVEITMMSGSTRSVTIEYLGRDFTYHKENLKASLTLDITVVAVKDSIVIITCADGTVISYRGGGCTQITNNDQMVILVASSTIRFGAQAGVLD